MLISFVWIKLFCLLFEYCCLWGMLLCWGLFCLECIILVFISVVLRIWKMFRWSLCMTYVLLLRFLENIESFQKFPNAGRNITLVWLSLFLWLMSIWGVIIAIILCLSIKRYVLARFIFWTVLSIMVKRPTIRACLWVAWNCIYFWYLSTVFMHFTFEVKHCNLLFFFFSKANLKNSSKTVPDFDLIFWILYMGYLTLIGNLSQNLWTSFEWFYIVSMFFQFCKLCFIFMNTRCACLRLFNLIVANASLVQSEKKNFLF